MKMYKPQNKIVVFDTTLRDGEQASGFHMLPDEKLMLAKAIQELGVDVIEAGFPISSPNDWQAVNTIAKNVEKPEIAALARLVNADIDAAAAALEPAIKRGKGRIHTFVATSNIHTEKKLRKSRKEVIEMAADAVSHAKKFTRNVEFSTEDFGRSSTDYIIDVVTAAISAGAKTINLPDTVGYLIPREMYNKTKAVIEGVGRKSEERGFDMSGIVFSSHCHNDLGNATAHTCEAILAGIRQIEVTINGIGERAGNASLEEVIANIKERGKYEKNPITDQRDPFYGLNIGHIDATKIMPTSMLLAKITDIAPQPNKAISGANAFAHEAGIHQHGILVDPVLYEWIRPESYGGKSRITLGPRSGKHAITAACAALGYHITPQDEVLVAKKFVEVTDGWKKSDDCHLIMAIYGDKEVPLRYELITPKTQGYAKHAKADLYVRQNGEMMHISGEGNGEIDAATNAIRKIVPFQFDIAEFRSCDLGRGSAAEGKEFVQILNNGHKTIGYGVDTSVVRGAIKALIQAINRMSYVISRQEK